MNGRERFLSSFDGKTVDRPPVWLMRQAGRYLPGYRAVRAKAGFWDVCHDPELSTKVALEPLARFPLDAAIVFSDILVIPQALGLDVTFGTGDGPRVGKPLRTRADLDGWNTQGLIDRLQFLPRAVKHLSAALKGSHAMIGFAGAPFTLFSYCVEGGSSDDFRLPRVMLHQEPKLAEAALATLADAAAELLNAQLDAGADAVQLFDTWGGLLAPDEYEKFALPALRRITDQLKGRRVLLFVRGGHHLLPLLGDSGAGGFSLDWRTPFAEARARYPNHVLQGNVDPVLLFAPEQVVRDRTAALLNDMRSTQYTRCIANLGHGILPGTPETAVEALCQTVVNANASR
ncbi:MAG: uroporphyrinogen decarboxylase [Archangiaceae bacterium]|nr:uroporphyrinogen decarboxylase [Archangiaceae bacterium]